MALARKLNPFSALDFVEPPKSTSPVPEAFAAKMKPANDQSKPFSATAAMAFIVPRETRRRVTELRQLQDALLVHLNTYVPENVTLVPGHILPVEVFTGDLGRFLMLACDLYPNAPENLYVSPATPEQAEDVQLPFFVQDMLSGAEQQATNRLQRLRDSVMLDHRRTAQALRDGDLTQLLQSKNRQQSYRSAALTIIRDTAIASFGAEAWRAHEEHFRPAIEGSY